MKTLFETMHTCPHRDDQGAVFFSYPSRDSGAPRRIGKYFDTHLEMEAIA